jgi:hypothetical protein
MDGVFDGYFQDGGNMKTIGYCSRDVSQALRVEQANFNQQGD